MAAWLTADCGPAPGVPGDAEPSDRAAAGDGAAGAADRLEGRLDADDWVDSGRNPIRSPSGAVGVSRAGSSGRRSSIHIFAAGPIDLRMEPAQE
jgi:hypothetical protein